MEGGRESNLRKLARTTNQFPKEGRKHWPRGQSGWGLIGDETILVNAFDRYATSLRKRRPLLSLSLSPFLSKFLLTWHYPSNLYLRHDAIEGGIESRLENWKRTVGFRFSIRFRTINIPGGIAANRDSQFLSFLRLLFSNLVAAVPARSGQVAAPLETSARGSSLKIL